MRVNLDDPKLEVKLKVYDAIIKGITALVIILTTIIGVSSYLSQRRELIKQNERYEEQRAKEKTQEIEQQRRDSEQRTRDFNSIIYRTRVELYMEATDALAKFAKARNLTEAENASTRFWELYHGKLSIIEDEKVKDEMIFCGDFIAEWESCKKAPPADVFQDLAYDLSQVCRTSLVEVFGKEVVTPPLDKPKVPTETKPEMIKEVCGK
jgi:hypothetical protein